MRTRIWSTPDTDRISAREFDNGLERAAIIDDRARVDEDLRMTPTDHIKHYLVNCDPMKRETTV